MLAVGASFESRLQAICLESDNLRKIDEQLMSSAILIGLRGISPGKIELLAICDEQHVLEVVSVKYSTLTEITDNDFKRELKSTWKRYYPYISGETELTVINWIFLDGRLTPDRRGRSHQGKKSGAF